MTPNQLPLGMSDSTSKAAVIANVCAALSADESDRAKTIARSEYPFDPAQHGGRRYTPFQSLEIFLRDGFIDRYSGIRLVFPGTLRLLSHLLPAEFPTHPNWKMAESHFVYWELFPTIDHLEPVARGGRDSADNWVCTSMLRNSAKSNWTLAELGWQLFPRGDPAEWDGLTTWFIDATRRHPEWITSAYLHRWRSAAVRLLGRTEPSRRQ